jgi:hypothetical protein
MNSMTVKWDSGHTTAISPSDMKSGGATLHPAGETKGATPSDTGQAKENADMTHALQGSQSAADTKAGIAADHGTAADRTPASSSAQWQQQMTHGQSQAVAGWKGSSTQIRNYAQGKDTSVAAKTAHDNFTKAVATAPEYKGPVYRGIRGLNDNQFQNLIGQKDVRMSAPASFSKDPQAALGFGTGSAVGAHSVTFQVESGHHGADISSVHNFSSEKEVVMPKGHSFNVTHVEVHDRLTDKGGKYAIMHLSPTGTSGGTPVL